MASQEIALSDLPTAQNPGISSNPKISPTMSATAAAKDVKFNLKVMMNEHNTKVVFAEVGSDFADVLLSFLTTPLGNIIRKLNKHYGDKEAPAIGSLSSLYNGLANLSTNHFWKEHCKDLILNPRSCFEAECYRLKLDINESKPPQPSYSSYDYYHHSSSSDDDDDDGQGGVFTLKKTSFIVSDDLQILPNTTSFLQTLGTLGIAHTADLGCSRNVTFGLNEIMDLLKRSLLLSPTPLSDVILKNNTKLPKSEPRILFPENESAAACPESKRKMVLTLRVNVQESTNKLLFCQAEEDFVDFLCMLLAIPLGGVECLLGGNTFLQCIDNVYSSLKNIDGYKYLATRDMKNRLIKPKLPHGYVPGNPILPLSEQQAGVSVSSSLTSSKGKGKYVGGPRMYKISDDLTVTPFCMASFLSDLKAMNIPLADVKELELEIGTKEALSILKASLTSKCALTDGLNINAMLMERTQLPKRRKTEKEVKQEN